MAKKQADEAPIQEAPEQGAIETSEPAPKSGHVSRDCPHHPLVDGCTVTIKAGREKYPDQAGRLAKLVKIETDGRVIIEFKDANSYTFGFTIEDLDHVE